jgi:hypothetical protein
MTDTSTYLLDQHHAEGETTGDIVLGAKRERDAPTEVQDEIGEVGRK